MSRGNRRPLRPPIVRLTPRRHAPRFREPICMGPRMSDSSQFRLLAERRFLPFFGAQALGAFNDNIYKNALVILATYQAASYTAIDPKLLTNLAGGLFILPYVLFSGIAGQLADRYDKALVLKVVKAAEILIMGLA